MRLILAYHSLYDEVRTIHATSDAVDVRVVRCGNLNERRPVGEAYELLNIHKHEGIAVCAAGVGGTYLRAACRFFGCTVELEVKESGRARLGAADVEKLTAWLRGTSGGDLPRPSESLRAAAAREVRLVVAASVYETIDALPPARYSFAKRMAEALRELARTPLPGGPLLDAFFERRGLRLRRMSTAVVDGRRVEVVVRYRFERSDGQLLRPEETTWHLLDQQYRVPNGPVAAYFRSGVRPPTARQGPTPECVLLLYCGPLPTAPIVVPPIPIPEWS